MTTKYWQISLEKDGQPVTLYATTTDAMIDLDLDGDPATSLILMARQFHRHPPTPDQNHRDLAIGAIMAHATEPPYSRTGARIEQTNSVPDGEPVVHVGGSRNRKLVPIWEEVEEESE